MRFLVYDFGLSVEHAARLVKDGHSVVYFTPWARGFPKFEDYAPGLNFDGLEKTLYFFDEIEKADCIVFFDIGAGDLCHYLRKTINKPIYGAGIGEKLENHRALLKEVMKKVGLPTPNYEVIKGVPQLREYLKAHPNKYVKLDIFRGDIECVDEKTEILTDKGWKFFNDLDKDKDKVLTLDLKTRKAYFAKPNQYFKSYYEGKMYRLRGRSIDLLVTPKHKFFVKANNTNKKWQYLPIEKIKDFYAFRLPLTFSFDGEERDFYLIKGIKKQTWKEKDKKVGLLTWLKFLGWFLSEGNLYQDNNHVFRVTISQSKRVHPEKWEEIKGVLEKLGYNFCLEGENGFSIRNKSLFFELLESCYEKGKCILCHKEYCGHLKKIPDYLFNLSPNLKRIFLQTFLKGDGCKEGRYNRYFTTSLSLANGLQILILMTGKNSNISWRKREDNWQICYEVSEGKTKNRLMKKENVKEEFYRGFVYDINVEPYHSFLIRRNGKVIWSGNSFGAKNYDSIKLYLDEIEVALGPFNETYEFVVEDFIDGIEPGFDGFFDGNNWVYPFLAGFEHAKSCYVGRYYEKDEFPKPLRLVADKLAPILRKLDYRGALSTEIRLTKDGTPYLIDVCARYPFPLSALYTESIKNYSEVIWKIANKQPVRLDVAGKYVAALPLATKHAEKNWVRLDFDPKLRKIVKTRTAAKLNNTYYGVKGMEVVYVLVAVGDDVEKLIRILELAADKVDAFGLDTDVVGGLHKIEEVLGECPKYGLGKF